MTQLANARNDEITILCGDRFYPRYSRVRDATLRQSLLRRATRCSRPVIAFDTAGWVMP